eukprot:1757985-Pyramimonas_sp.AAC.1
MEAVDILGWRTRGRRTRRRMTSANPNQRCWNTPSFQVPFSLALEGSTFTAGRASLEDNRLNIFKCATAPVRGLHRHESTSLL